MAMEVAALANAIMEGGEWPDDWKRAEIRVIWKKKGSKSDTKMYRPISILPAISRLIERLVERQLRQHLDALLPDEQHGFRAGHGTTTALSQIVSLVARARANKNTRAVAIASMDAKAAFDTADHKLLLTKLERLGGIQGKVLQLVKSYLKNRRQRVKMNGERRSNMVPVGEIGVPQGAVLAPLLWAIYTMDLPKAVTKGDVVMYADDVTILTYGRTPEEAQKKMGEAMAEYHAYAIANRVLPEPSKTQYMILCNTWNTDDIDRLATEMAGSKIKPQKAVKILGVLIDHKINWEPQSVAAAGKAKGVAMQISRLGKGLPKKQIARLMMAMALPILDYAQPVIAQNPKKNSTGETVQRAAEVITETAYKMIARLATRARRVPTGEWKEHEKKLGEDLLKGAKVEEVPPETAAGLALGTLVIKEVRKRSPADKGGLWKAERIKTVNGTPVGTIAEMNKELTRGNTATLGTVKEYYKLPPTKPILKELKWPDWKRRTLCMKAAFASKVWTTGKPIQLAKWLPPPPTGSLEESIQSGEHTQPMTTSLMGHSLRASRTTIAREQATGKSDIAFEVWAPRVLNRFHGGVPFPGEENEEEESLTDEEDSDSGSEETSGDIAKELQTPGAAHESKVKTHKPPEDDQWRQMNAYYGMLTHKFEGRQDNWDEEGRRKVWTDGSSTLDPATGKRTAGAGIFYGDRNPHNCGVRVKIAGKAMSKRATNQRAELAAALHMLETNKGPLRIITDSMYVHLGIQETRHRWRQQAWLDSSTQGRFVKHADLWRKLDQLLCQRPKNSVVTQWTKGHARPTHVIAGLSTELDTWGNTGADGLAGRGAQCEDIVLWPGPTAELRKVRGPRPGEDHLTEKQQYPQNRSPRGNGSKRAEESHKDEYHTQAVDPGEEELWAAIW